MLGRDFLRNLVNRLFITACLLATVAAITALVWLVGRRSPLRAFASGRRKARAARVPRRARVATS